MSYCYDFIKKFRKEGNFCGLDKSEVSRLEAYIEIIEALMKQHIEEKTIVDNFPLGAARHLIPIKDERRADGLSYVTQQLKAGKHISGKDIQQKLEISNKKPQSKQELEKGNKSVKIENTDSEPKNKEPEKKTDAIFGKTGIPQTDDEPMKSVGEREREKEQAPVILPHPASCLSGKACPGGISHFIRAKPGALKGNLCEAIEIEIKQLPDYGTGIQECPLERNARLKSTKPNSFETAAQMKNESSGITDFTKIKSTQPLPTTSKHPLLKTRSEQDAATVRWMDECVNDRYHRQVKDIIQEGKAGSALDAWCRGLDLLADQMGGT